MFEKKTWKDRISEYPTRRVLTKMSGETEVVDVARNEGTISQEGDAFSAQNMNDLEERIKTELDNALYIVSFDASTGTLVTKSADYEG